MHPFCPHSQCEADRLNLENQRVVRKGWFTRKSDRKKIFRYFCQKCHRYYSTATTDVFFGQKKRQINLEVFKLLASGNSMRRTSKLCGVKTRAIKLRMTLFSKMSQVEHQLILEEMSSNPFTDIQFDEMRTIEHTKCKPVTIGLAVVAKERFILGFGVGRMPADGPLAEIARKKYGFRPNERDKVMDELFQKIKIAVSPTATFTSDNWPTYGGHVRKHFPNARHIQVNSPRGCVAGQGELKKTKFDPMFSLNHTCAMFRANVSRLIRRTWSTTKKLDRLEDHLWIYLKFHNSEFTKYSLEKMARAA